MSKPMVDAVPYTVLRLIFAAIDEIDNRCTPTRMARIAVQADIDRLVQLHDEFRNAVVVDATKSATCFFVYAEFQLSLRLLDLRHKAADEIGAAPPGNNAFMTFTWFYKTLTRLASTVDDPDAFDREKRVLFYRLSDHIVYEHALIFGSFARMTVQQRIFDEGIRWDFERGHARVQSECSA